MAGWYASCARKLRTAGTAESAFGLATALALIAGIALRFQGQLTKPSSLWQDEALWASHLINRPMLSHNIRPIGFMWAARQLVDLFAVSEFWLRFIPNITSVIALLLAPYVASQLTQSRLARLTFVVLFAIHPALIDFSKEFKPYSSEVLVHLAFVALYLRWRETGRKVWLIALLAALPLSFLFAYNLAFAFPGLLLLAFFDAFKAGRWRAALPAVASGALCLAVLVSVHLTLLGRVSRGNTEERWGRKYDIFYRDPAALASDARRKASRAAPSASAQPPVAKPAASSAAESGQAGESGQAPGADPTPPADAPGEADALQPPTPAGTPDGEPGARQADKPSSSSRAAWLARKYADVAALPGLRRKLWHTPAGLSLLPQADYLLWVALHAAGLVALFLQRRYAHSLLLVMPLFVVVVCNVVGLWPMGAFRSNLFLCAYVIAIASIGVDAVAAAPRRALVLGVLLSMIYLLPGFALGFDWRGRKQMWTRESSARQVVERLRFLREQQLEQNRSSPRIAVVSDLATLEPVNFYIRYHHELRPLHGEFFKEHLRVRGLKGYQARLPSELKRRLAGAKSRPVMIVATKNIPEIQAILHQNTKVLNEEIIDGQHLVAVVAAPTYRRGWP